MDGCSDRSQPVACDAEDRGYVYSCGDMYVGQVLADGPPKKFIRQ